MRWLIFVVMSVAVACGRGDSGNAGSGGARPNGDADREQARFDAERKPDKIVEALAIAPGARVADVGAGTGLLTVHLARAVAPKGKVIATEVDGTALELLKQRMERLGLAEVVESRVVKADKPGLEDGAYDAILLSEVDNLMDDPVAWLVAAKPALKPHGRIVISNRTYHRAHSLESARKAGLQLVAESNPMPTNFIAVFVAGDAK